MNIPLSMEDKLEIIFQFALRYMREDLRNWWELDESLKADDEAAISWLKFYKRYKMLEENKS